MYISIHSLAAILKITVVSCTSTDIGYVSQVHNFIILRNDYHFYVDGCLELYGGVGLLISSCTHNS